jgi:hypothetical protein
VRFATLNLWTQMATLKIIDSIAGDCKLKSRRLCERSQCANCFERSLASNSTLVAMYCDERPAFCVSLYSTIPCLFKCLNPSCGHFFSTAPQSISRAKGPMSRGEGCPYCVSSGRLCGDERCLLCVRRSLASVSHIQSLYVGEQPLHTIPKMALRQRIQLKCSKCGLEWDSTPTSLTRGTGCPACSKTGAERLMVEVLSSSTQIGKKCILFRWNVEWSPSWLGQRRFDFVVETCYMLASSFKRVVEVDGKQHFVDWTPIQPEHRGLMEERAIDISKMQAALTHGVPIIRLRAFDIKRATLEALLHWLVDALGRAMPPFPNGKIPILLPNQPDYHKMHNSMPRTLAAHVCFITPIF